MDRTITSITHNLGQTSTSKYPTVTTCYSDGGCTTVKELGTGNMTVIASISSPAPTTSCVDTFYNKCPSPSPTPTPAPRTLGADKLTLGNNKLTTANTAQAISSPSVTPVVSPTPKITIVTNTAVRMPQNGLYDSSNWVTSQTLGCLGLAIVLLLALITIRRKRIKRQSVR